MKFPLSKEYSAVQFAWWRIIFGAYLFYYTARTFPYREELFSSRGMLSDPALNWTYGYFPDLLYWFDRPAVLTFLFAAMGISSLAVLIGYHRRLGALCMWFALATLFNRNVLIEDPSLPFIGLLLIFIALIPSGEPYSLLTWLRRARQEITFEWYMPSAVYWGAWFVLGLSFTATGIDRLFAQTWQDGTALYYLLHQPIAHDTWITQILLALPLRVLKILSWIPEIVYIISLPCIFLARSRRFIWILWVLMFVFVFFTLELTQVVLGMLLYFAFLFDSTWLTRSSGHAPPAASLFVVGYNKCESQHKDIDNVKKATLEHGARMRDRCSNHSVCNGKGTHVESL